MKKCYNLPVDDFSFKFFFVIVKITSYIQTLILDLVWALRKQSMRK